MNRYEDVTADEHVVLKEVRERHFSELASAEIKLVFDTKKKKSGGKIVLARIKKPNEVEKYLCQEPVDYIIFIDQNAWMLAEAGDKIRLMRHELRHTDVNLDAAKPFKLRAHTVEDFYREIDLNQEKPRWADELALLVDMKYEEENE
jgi:hypothetical protein